MFVNREKPTNAFVKTNGSVNARKIRKPKKTDLRFFLNKRFFFFRKTGQREHGQYLDGARSGEGLRRAGSAAGQRGSGGGSGGRGCGAPALPVARGEANGGRRRAARCGAAAAASPAMVAAKTEGGAIYR